MICMVSKTLLQSLHLVLGQPINPGKAVVVAEVTILPWQPRTLSPQFPLAS